MRELVAELKREMRGEVWSDELSKRVYSIDASIYQILPVAIACPRDAEDVYAALHIAQRCGVPVIPRGGGTGIAGGCLGAGLVLDMSRHMKKIRELNVEEGWALCEPGVVQDQLNLAASPHGLRLGPDTSTGNRATIGGMCANNSAGSNSLRYGKMVDHVLEWHAAFADASHQVVRSVDADGFRHLTEQATSFASALRELEKIIHHGGSAIRAAFPTLQRRVSGYNLDEMVKGFPLDLPRLLVGSEGSLALGTLFKVRLSQKPKFTVLTVVPFADFRAGLELVPELLLTAPFAFEMIDGTVIHLGRASPMMRGQLGWLKGNPNLLLCLEYDGATPGEALAKQEALHAVLKRLPGVGEWVDLNESRLAAQVWKLRKSGLGILMSKRGEERAQAFLEDVAVPPERLPEFLTRFRSVIEDSGRVAGFYGHAGVGCIHVRPMINLRQEEDRRWMVKTMEEVTEVVREFRGSVSGEHGDGLIRSWLNPRLFGAEVDGLFRQLKHAFDPENRLNPGKIVNGPPPLENLRVDANVVRAPLETAFDWSREGGIHLALDMCNGNGECTRFNGGLMCPSFQASGDEFHSTRARAQALNAVINGGADPKELTSPRMMEILDLCVECKGCKTECPSQVDMAKLKSEVLHRHHQEHGVPARARFFADAAKSAALGSKFPRIANALIGNSFSRRLLDKYLGVSAKRSLPQLALKRASQLLPNYVPQDSLDPVTGQPRHPKPVVALFLDTFTEYYHPEIALAANKVLQGMGFVVAVPPPVCCGRPKISKGLLDEAKESARATAAVLSAWAEREVPILVLEPGCLSALIDDHLSLLPGNAASAKISQRAISFDAFVAEHSDKLLPLLRDDSAEVLVHGHCHQKALLGTAHIATLLGKLPGLRAKEIDSGCCGMAGSFGYESEHHDFSLAIGETRLFPALRLAPQAQVIATGSSCRSQIADGVQRKAEHLAVFLAERMKG
ncbi:MAG: hypothetical protein RL095_944 [Verrucomicrobiota bacterium]|jgi:FAD/FMN-containing dehydrogenase/Fe-S oxidoreductase